MTTTSTANWICSEPNSQASLHLFCFPYAGGGALSFRTWSNILPPTVEVCPVEFPGRGRRFIEAPFNRLEPLVGAIARALVPYLDKPFAFFGHSMGGLVSFELTRLLYKQHGISPVHLFISGRRAPQVCVCDAPIHALPEQEFLTELRRLNGTPEVVLQNVELMKLLIPTLRADFAVLETYVYASEPPLECPITVFGGLQDKEVTREQLEAWQQQTRASFTLQMLPGDHFFIHSAQALLLQSLVQKLNLD